MQAEGKECSVCAKTAASYKCAQCRTPYCCVACYKTHKDLCSKVAPVAVHKGSKAAGTGGAGGAGEGGNVSAGGGNGIRNADILHNSQLAALDKDADLQRLLRSERLMAHIRAVDLAPDRPRALKRLREAHPEFNDFVGKAVKVVSCPALQTGADELQRRAAQEERKAAVARLVEEARAEAARVEEGEGEDEDEEDEEDGDENEEDEDEENEEEERDE